MEPITLTLAVLGAIGGIGSRIKDRRAMDLQDMILARRKKSNEREMNLSARIMSGDMTIGALSATEKDKAGAVEAFRAGSAADAAMGVSGLSSGTMQSQVEKAKQDARESLSAMSRSSKLQLQNLHTQDEITINNYRDRAGELDLQMDEIDNSLEYLTSPFSFIMAAGTGALSGAALGNKIEAGLVKMTGKSSGEWLAGLFEKPAPEHLMPAMFPRNPATNPMPWESEGFRATPPHKGLNWNYFPVKGPTEKPGWDLFKASDPLFSLEGMGPSAFPYVEDLVNNRQFFTPFPWIQEEYPTNVWLPSARQPGPGR